MGRNYIVYSKNSSTPRRPFEKERLDRELKLCGQFGLRNKREVWRVQYILAKLRMAARTLLTLPVDDPKRKLEGAAILRRMTRLGLLDEHRQKLDYVLSLKAEDFLNRRLQTVIVKLNLAKTIHHARVMIRQGHISVGKQVVTIPSFVVRVDQEQYITLTPTSVLVTGEAGRVKKKSQNKKKESSDE